MGLEEELKVSNEDENLSEKYDRIRNENMERMYNGKLHKDIYSLLVMYSLVSKH